MEPRIEEMQREHDEQVAKAQLLKEKLIYNGYHVVGDIAANPNYLVVKVS